MNERGSFLAALLDASGKAFAAGAILRLAESGPEAERFVQTWGFDGLVDDAQARLLHLAEALACGRPELLALDVEWLAATYVARGIPLEHLKRTLECLRDELAENLPPDAGPKIEAYVGAALERLENPPAAPPSLLESNGKLTGLTREFVAAVLSGDRRKAEDLVMGAQAAGASASDLLRDVVARAQDEIGRMWQRGEVHVHEEHLGSRIVEGVLARLRATDEDGARRGPSVLTAAVAGDLHDIGTRIVSDHFERAGWRSYFLGANTPKEDLVQAVHDFRPDLVALSVGLTALLRTASETIRELRKHYPDLPILVGGGPFAKLPDLWKDVGADASASDAVQAVELGTELVAGA